MRKHPHTHAHAQAQAQATSLLSPHCTGFTRLVCRQGLLFCFVFVCLRVCVCWCACLNLPATHTTVATTLRGSGEPELSTYTHTKTHNVLAKILTNIQSQFSFHIRRSHSHSLARICTHTHKQARGERGAMRPPARPRVSARSDVWS